MKKHGSGKRGLDPPLAPPDKTGWIRKFCGRGIFREIWKNRYVVLRGDQLFVCEKEVKEAGLGRCDEQVDLSDYERCEELKKNKSRSKKNLSKFRLQRCSSPGNTVPNLVFLAVSPEDKESWISALNAAITRAKNRILDEVTVEESQLAHLTRDRVKIPHNRRLPTRGHLLTVASTCSSDGTLTLDLIQEEDSPRPSDCPRSRTDGALSVRTAEVSGKSRSLPRDVAVWEHLDPVQTGTGLMRDEKNRCASMDQILTQTAENKMVASRSPTSSPAVTRLQDLIQQKLDRTERLLQEVRGEVGEETEAVWSEAERLLQEATAAWSQAHRVLEEVTELRALYLQLDSPRAPLAPPNGTNQDQE